MILLKAILILHVIAGFTSLFTGPVAMIAKKGGKTHNRWGMVYFYGMTLVFITALAVQPFHFTPFLFMIAFLSYYSVFSGVRFTRLKKLHEGQKAAWFDWAAGIINFIANIAFIGYGVYHFMNHANNYAGILAIVFGTLGSLLSINNLTPFVQKPKHHMYWWFFHMGNMLGGYVATTTAFSTTIFGMMEVESPLVWIWPLALGIPASKIWRMRYMKKFKIPAKAV